MYFSLRQNLDTQRCVTQYPSTEISFLDGKTIDQSQVSTPIRVSGTFDRENPPGHFELGVIPIFSDKLIEFLRQGGVDNVQTFPAIIGGDNGSEWQEYKAVQVVGLLRCADMDSSKYSVIGPGDGVTRPPLVVFSELEINPEKVPKDLKLFRLAEQPSILIISETLLDWLLENRPATGWGFIYEQVSPLEDD